MPDDSARKLIPWCGNTMFLLNLSLLADPTTPAIAVEISMVQTDGHEAVIGLAEFDARAWAIVTREPWELGNSDLRKINIRAVELPKITLEELEGQERPMAVIRVFTSSPFQETIMPIAQYFANFIFWFKSQLGQGYEIDPSLTI